MQKAYLECISLGKIYSGKKQEIHAVRDVNLSIEKGSFVLVKGRSGAGKSTLLNLMAGLIRPTSGSVRIDDQVISSMDNRALSSFLMNKAGVIFQSLNLLPAYTIYENLEASLPPGNQDSTGFRNLIAPYLQRFGLYDKLNYMPDELSLGQQQKVAVVRTLIKKPSIIFADEPTASVDGETASEILEALSNLSRENNVTVIVATHGIVPSHFADREIILENGSLAGS
jgi:putative ABC transport system ATP-binding protein